MDITTSYIRLDLHSTQVPLRIMRLSESALSHRPAPGKWSKREILGHLVDSARYNLMRFTEGFLSPSPYQVTPYPQADLVRLNAYQAQPLENIVLLWQALNRQILHVLGKRDQKDFAQKILLTDGTPETMGWLFSDYVVHLEHHLLQIFGEESKDEADRWKADNGLRAVTEAEALLQLEAIAPATFKTVMSHGPMKVEYYKPVGKDHQTPHTQDELYVIAHGSGIFVNDKVKHPFGPGDVLYVPAGVAHRFEDFSEDFATWVIFYGGKRPLG